MNWLPELTLEDIQIISLLITGVSSFYIYWFITESEKVKNYFYLNFSPDKAVVKHIFFVKILGFITLGVLNLAAAGILFSNPWQELGFIIPSDKIAFVTKSVLLVSCLTIPVGVLASRNKKTQQIYPQIRKKEWTYSTFFISLFGWAVYLLGYEILFRGLLLQPFEPLLGFWLTVGINTVLYSLVHLPKGIGETLGSIPLGFVLATLCLSAETFWIGFFVHVIMAWTNNISSFINNPEMTFKR